MKIVQITVMLAVALTVTACAKEVEDEMMVKEEMTSSKL
jgi:hypothetical protein